MGPGHPQKARPMAVFGCVCDLGYFLSPRCPKVHPHHLVLHSVASCWNCLSTILLQACFPPESQFPFLGRSLLLETLWCTQVSSGQVPTGLIPFPQDRPCPTSPAALCLSPSELAPHSCHVLSPASGLGLEEAIPESPPHGSLQSHLRLGVLPSWSLEPSLAGYLLGGHRGPKLPSLCIHIKSKDRNDHHPSSSGLCGPWACSGHLPWACFTQPSACSWGKATLAGLPQCTLTFCAAVSSQPWFLLWLQPSLNNGKCCD